MWGATNKLRQFAYRSPLCTDSSGHRVSRWLSAQKRGPAPGSAPAELTLRSPIGEPYAPPELEQLSPC
jgi:hypothetical protein